MNRLQIALASVAEYTVQIEHRYLDGREWKSRSHDSREERLTLAGLPVTASLAAIYELVDI